MVSWVETRTVLRLLGGGARKKYRRYVEVGKGEKEISPFERAVAGLVLGSESFVRKVRGWLSERGETTDQPSLRALERYVKADPEAVEAATKAVFAEVSSVRQGRLLLYTQRQFSSLRPSEIARRYGRRPSAVTMACRAIEAEAESTPLLLEGLAAVREMLETVPDTEKK